MAHSVGLVVTDRDPTGGHEFSFEVQADGEIVEVAGWGWCGRVPDVGPWNVPPSPLAVHSVLVEGDSVEVLAGLRQLLEQHLALYGERRVWLARPPSRAIADWIAVGCPPVQEEVLTDG